ncbi:MFS transporter [Marinicella meishanensis]|uniref:MFS transporter n=1 Tax=Marinicella meishanensis TaxID=2873263 RepID=UPI0032AFEB95
MNSLEKKSAWAIAFMIALRMYGLFLILPVFAIYAAEVPGTTPVLMGLAIGVYGLTQALLQIPMGFMSDLWGRKKIMTLGLGLFIIGSVMAAMATDIYWIIAGRLVQGMGAIAATGLALVADVSRPEQRGKMMAVIGSSIGLSFMLAFITGPILAQMVGLSGLFWLTAGLALLALFVLLWVVEEPPKRQARDYRFQEMLHCVRQKELLWMDVAVFALHASMTALFLVVPLVLVQQFDLALESHWQLYLPVLLLSLAIMLPLIIGQEKLNMHWPFMTAGFMLLGISLLLINMTPEWLWLMAACLVLYFGLFNYLEAAMPSALSRMADEQYRGAAMGVFATSEFLGAFVGGAIGGYILGFNPAWVLPFMALLLLLVSLVGMWLLFSRRQRPLGTTQR